MQLLRILTIVLECFVAASAIFGGVFLVVEDGNGLTIPAEWLNGSFQSFVVPGMILGIVIGGTQTIAAIAEWLKRSRAEEATAVAGFALLIWIFAEIYILKHAIWLQILYFAIGVIILASLLMRVKYRHERH